MKHITEKMKALIKRTNQTLIEPEDAEKHMKRGYGFRLILSIAVIIAGLKLPFVHFVGVFAGMMTLKAAVFIRPLVCRFIFHSKPSI